MHVALIIITPKAKNDVPFFPFEYCRMNLERAVIRALILPPQKFQLSGKTFSGNVTESSERVLTLLKAAE